MPSRTQSLANPFYSHNSILGILCFLSCSNYNLASPVIILLPLQLSSGHIFLFCTPFTAEPRGGVFFPHCHFLTILFQNFKLWLSCRQMCHPLPLCISVICQLSWVIPLLPWTLISSWLTVFFISVTILGSWWYQSPCRAALVTVASALGTVCYRYELLSGLCARI